MNAALQPFGETFAQRQLRVRLEHSLDQKKLFAAIDADPELVGAGVVYIDANYTIVTLREFQPLCRIEPIKIILREPRQPTSSIQHAQDLSSTPRESQMLAEVLGASLSCGAALLSWVVIVGSTGAIPLTGGASSALTALSYSAFAASSLQCMNGLARVGIEARNPEFKDQIDSEEWYNTATTSLDVISLGGAAAAGFVTVRMVKTLHAQGVTIREALEGLSRRQRTRLTEEIVRMNKPGISNKMLKFLKRNGTVPKRYTKTQISHATKRQLKDALGAFFSFSGSASNGVVRTLAIGIYEEVQ
ncbi:hypothetical protein [Marinobacter sp. ANT_B65]|uniref:hypothetical protein n=1 Tax=Marinobacter sp. ANT_B65 TaxID=2039467 RepID=UPI000BBE5C09|nr:hypothetical protein [Marinobacter sp. ANT_B65]PCM46101.1 hypothetical protein CPA50_09175 [Marinobacter sp. ANT_B65]